MASIYELMAGNLGDESGYLADEPLFASAKNLSQLDTGPSAWGNRKVSGFEQFALPFVKGLLTNYMLKQAKENAQDEYYKDAQQSPILRQLEASLQPKGVGPVADGNQYAAILEDNTKAPQGSPLADALLGKFSGEERPDGYTAKAMKSDMMSALLERSQEQEKAKIREALAAEMDKMRLKNELEQGQGAIDFAEKKAKAEAAGKLAAEGGSGLPDLKGVPLKFTEEAQKELSEREKARSTDEYINELYDKALKTSTAKSLKPGSKETSAFDGVTAALLVHADFVKGTETSEPGKEEIRKAIGVTRYDTPEQIEEKRQRALAMFKRLGKPTPILDSVQGKTPERKKSGKPPLGRPGESYPNYLARIAAGGE
jgi:hypothetical protein